MITKFHFYLLEREIGEENRSWSCAKLGDDNSKSLEIFFTSLNIIERNRDCRKDINIDNRNLKTQRTIIRFEKEMIQILMKNSIPFD